MKDEIRVWTCKIVSRSPIPNGFDGPPRSAAVQACEDAGVVVDECFSGWGGSLTDSQREVMEENATLAPEGDTPGERNADT